MTLKTVEKLAAQFSTLCTGRVYIFTDESKGGYGIEKDNEPKNWLIYYENNRRFISQVLSFHAAQDEFMSILTSIRKQARDAKNIEELNETKDRLIRLVGAEIQEVA